jgi:dihydroorotate dehydrogenase electron transfer subunit
MPFGNPGQGGGMDATQSQHHAAFPVQDIAATVLANNWVNSEYKLLELSASGPALRVAPGQFFHLSCPAIGPDQPLLRRPMSIYGIDPISGRLRFLYKVQGAGTRSLAALTPGDTLPALGPLGRGFRLPRDTRHVLMLARGVGLATLAPLAAAAAQQGARVTAILSARRPDLVMSQAELQKVGAEIHPVTDTDGTSDIGRLEDCLYRLHAAHPIDYIATCGANRLLLLAQRLANSFACPGEVALEQHMGCALGMCHACVRPMRATQGSDHLTYRRVCWDGPVFPLQEALSW